MYLQYLISVALVLFVVAVCFFVSHFIGYRIVAMILLMTVSVLAMLFEIFPVLVAALLSAVLWNFLFIPPLFTFHIDRAEDVLMFLLYFTIASVNAVLTFQIRLGENRSRDREEKENTIRLYATLLNSLSHELRTPISTIFGAVDVLKDKSDNLSQKNRIELLAEIDKASIRLNRQVENLLNMSRLESGMLKPKPIWCDVNEIIYSVIEKALQDSNRKIDFQSTENLPLFRLDAGLLEQIIYNIVHNALQYTPEDAEIHIDVEHLGGACVLRVSDSGSGFPENEMDRVFDKFYRLPYSKTGGSGLGLSIVKGFVEAFQGSVYLTNNPKGGATFRVEIPAETSYLNNLKNE